jgi:hypothetical protein
MQPHIAAVHVALAQVSSSPPKHLISPVPFDLPASLHCTEHFKSISLLLMHNLYKFRGGVSQISLYFTFAVLSCDSHKGQIRAVGSILTNTMLSMFQYRCSPQGIAYSVAFPSNSTDMISKGMQSRALITKQRTPLLRQIYPTSHSSGATTGLTARLRVFT